MDPRFFLIFATDLLNRLRQNQGLSTPGGRAECRSAISRAYYATFLVAVEFLNGIGISVTAKGECHTAVNHGLNNSGNQDLKKAASNLGTLGTERRTADYQMAQSRPEQIAQVEIAVEMATQAILALDQIKNDCRADARQGATIASTILGWAGLVQNKHLWKTTP